MAHWLKMLRRDDAELGVLTKSVQHRRLVTTSLVPSKFSSKKCRQGDSTPASFDRFPSRRTTSAALVENVAETHQFRRDVTSAIGRYPNLNGAL